MIDNRHLLLQVLNMLQSYCKYCTLVGHTIVRTVAFENDEQITRVYIVSRVMGSDNDIAAVSG